MMTEQEYARLLALQEAGLAKFRTGALSDNHDVDTLDMRNAQGIPTRVRVLGVDGPEKAKFTPPGVSPDPGQPFADEAGQGLRNIIGNQQITQTNNQGLDVFGRDLARVQAGGVDVGMELVKQGFAAVPPAYGDEDPHYHQELLTAQAEARQIGKGMWNPNNGVTEMPWDYRNRIAREQGRGRGDYVKQETILDDIGGAMSYGGNVVRSAVAGALDPRGTAWLYAKQAANKQRTTDATQLKDSITKNIFNMQKPLRFGQDGNGFDWGDIPDVALDTLIDIGTDPMTLVAAGPVSKVLGKAVRGGAELAGMGKLASVATDAAVGRTAMAAGYGMGALGDGGKGDDTTMTQRLAAASLAAMAGAFAPFVAKQVSGAAASMANGMVDRYMNFTRAADDYSQVAQMARVGVDEAMNNASSGAMRYKANVLSPLDGPDRIKFVGMLNEGKTWEVIERNKWLASHEGANAFDTQKAFAGIRDLSQNRLADSSLKLGKQFVASTEGVFTETKNQMAKVNAALPEGSTPLAGFGVYFPDVWANESGVFDTLNASFADQNIKRAKSAVRQNAHYARAVEMFAKSGGSGLAVDDADKAVRMLAKKRMMKPDEWNIELIKQPSAVQDFVSKAIEGQIKVPEELILKGIDDTVDVYYRKYGWHTVDSSARDAIETMADIMNRKVGEGALFPQVKDASGKLLPAVREKLDIGQPGMVAARVLEKTMHVWDVAQSFVVRNQLFGGLSWLKNNYWENSLKAYMSGGLAGLMDSTMYNNVRHEIFQDIWRMNSGEGTSLMKSAHVNDLARAVELGVVSNPSARALGSGSKQDLQKYIYSPAGLTRVAEKEAADAARPALEKGMDAWGDALAGSVGRVGSTLENNSRYSAWVRMRDAMRKAEPTWAKDVAKSELIDRQAAEAIKRTFYDYGDISEFNRLVTKRIAPYASYYMKNIPYYVGAAFDTSTHGNEIVTQAMRTGIVEKVVRHIGGEPTEKDRKGLPDYLLANRPRILERDRKGLSVGIMPAFSRDDAIRMTGISHPLEMGKAYLEKINPMIKAPLEVLSGYDTFTGSPLVPSNLEAKPGERTGRKYLFGRGFLPAAVGAVEVDEHGNPYTQSDAYARFDKLRSAFLPLPGVEAAASIIGQDAYGKRPFTSGIFNKFVSPLQDVDVSSQMMRATKAKKKKEFGDGK